MSLPAYFDSATQIVQAGLNEKLPPGWERICVIGATPVVEGPNGKKEDAIEPGRCLVMNKTAYVLANVDAVGKELNLNSAARALKLLTHEIAGHAIGELRALSHGDDEGSEEEDHLRMIRPLDGREGENTYLSAIRKVLPHVNVQSFHGLREKILEEYPELAAYTHIPDSLNPILDDMLKQAYLHSCVDDIENQVLGHLGSGNYTESDPAIVMRCEELVDPLREAADEPGRHEWATP